MYFSVFHPCTSTSTDPALLYKVFFAAGAPPCPILFHFISSILFQHGYIHHDLNFLHFAPIKMAFHSLWVHLVDSSLCISPPYHKLYNCWLLTLSSSHVTTFSSFFFSYLVPYRASPHRYILPTLPFLLPLHLTPLCSSLTHGIAFYNRKHFQCATL